MLVHQINEIAKKHCNDYPGINECDPNEKLIAISQCLEGSRMANKDLHSIIVYLGSLLGINDQTELYNLCQKRFEEQLKDEIQGNGIS